MALLARRMVGDVAHGIDRLARRARRHDSPLPGQWSFGWRQQALDGVGDFFWLRHAAGPEFVAGHGAVVGPDEMDAALLQGLDVGDGRRMGPHAYVHRRRRQHRLVGGEQHGRGEIVGQARRHARQDVGGRRRHHQQVGIARELDVAHLAFVGQREHVAVDAIFGQSLQRQRRDEFGAGLGQHAAHRSTAFAQAADELERLEGRDAPRDDQQNPLALEHGSQPITTPGWRKYTAR